MSEGKAFTEVKDSGKRQNFTTGSVRDTDEGKGNPHLIAGEPFKYIPFYFVNGTYDKLDLKHLLKEIQMELFEYSKINKTRKENDVHLCNAMYKTCLFIDQEAGIKYHSLQRLAQHYQNGAIKYDANNWRKGQPVSRYYDSAQRHLWKLMARIRDEDHASALLWNLVAIFQTKIDVGREMLPKELDDYPYTIDEVWK
jgi:hypothetical protein